jgi:hypothetical protein
LEYAAAVTPKGTPGRSVSRVRLSSTRTGPSAILWGGASVLGGASEGLGLGFRGYLEAQKGGGRRVGYGATR